MQTTYDAVIAGGGPAGATAALVLARAGFSVVVLDGASFPREKLCGGLLSRKTVDLVNTLHKTTDDELCEIGVIDSSSYGYDIFFKGDLLSRGTAKHPFHFVQRSVFDNWLLTRAQESGVVVHTGQKITECDPLAGTVTIEDGTVFTGKYVVGADGVNSRVRQFFPLDKQRWRNALASTVEIRIPVDEYPVHVQRPAVHVGYVGEGYGWVFPNQDAVVVGLGGVVAEGENLADLFRIFLSSLGVTNHEQYSLKGHPLPCGNFLPELCFGRAVLAGDAGGLVEPVFGEGIFYAIRSGQAAGLAVAKAIGKKQPVATLYHEAIRDDIYTELVYSRKIRKAIYFFDRYGLHPFVKVGVYLCRNKLLDVVHGQRSFRFFKKIQTM